MHTRSATGNAPFTEGELTPCDDCSQVAICHAQKLACDSLSLYSLNVHPLRWKLAPKVPTTYRYELMMQRLAA